MHTHRPSSPYRLVCLSILSLLLLIGCADESTSERTSPAAEPQARTRDSAATDAPPVADDTAETTSPNDTAQATLAADSSAAARPLPTARRYNIESGVVELKSNVGSQRQQIYFDDYGAKEAVHVITEGSGTTNTTIVVNAGGSSVVYDPEKKAGTRADLSDALSQLGLGGIPNLGSLDERMKRELKYRPIAGRTILGRKADGASIEVVGTPLKIWTYEGIPLRMEATMQGNALVVEATSLKTDVAIPASRFVVPSDVKLRDLKTNP